MVEYRPGATPESRWTKRAHELQLQGRIDARIMVSGKSRQLVAVVECPRCAGIFSIDVDSTAVVVGGGYLGDRHVGELSPPIAPAPKNDDVVAETIRCAGPPVDGTPEGDKGCGAAFKIWAHVDWSGSK